MSDLRAVGDGFFTVSPMLYKVLTHGIVREREFSEDGIMTGLSNMWLSKKS